MAARSIPENGDIVVREEEREGARVYVLHTAPGPDECLYRTHEEAVSYAIRTAARVGVRVWLTDEGFDFVMLEDFRADGPA